MLLKKGQSLWK